MEQVRPKKLEDLTPSEIAKIRRVNGLIRTLAQCLTKNAEDITESVYVLEQVKLWFLEMSQGINPNKVKMFLEGLPDEEQGVKKTDTS